MKYHLLQNYENFILISHKDKYKDKVVKALQDHSNKVTIINEKILFNSFYSEKFVGLDNFNGIFSRKFSFKKKFQKFYENYPIDLFPK